MRINRWLVASLIGLSSALTAHAQSLPPPPDYPLAAGHSSYRAASASPAEDRGGPVPGQRGLDAGRRAQRGRGRQQGQGSSGKGQRLKALFARFDINHKGHLDANEQRRAVAAILSSPRVRQRLAQNPQKQSQIRSRLTRFAAHWHSGGGRKLRAQAEESEGEMTDMGLFG